MTLSLPDAYGVREKIAGFVSTHSSRVWVGYVVVFISYFAAAKFGQWLFFTYNLSTSLLSPAAGIALAAVFLGGYRMLIPIAVAHLIAGLTTASSPLLLVVLGSTLGYVIQSATGAALLKRFNFKGSMERAWDAILIIIVALTVSSLAPSITTTFRFFTETLSDPFLVTLIRGWSGGILSIIVMTPLITVFLTRPRTRFKNRRYIEGAAALTLLGVITYLAFWTTLPQLNVFLTIYAVLAAFFWISLRLSPPGTVLGVFLMTVLGMAGSIVGRPLDAPIAGQISSNSLFIALVGPIFYILNGVVSERRAIVRELRNHAARLEEAVKELSHSDKIKNEFIATLAHELRNPLAPIVSTLELLKLRETNAENLKLLEDAEHQTATMRRLLEDLLDVTRVSQKKFKLQLELTDVATSMKNAVASTKDFIWKRGHTLTVVEPSKPISLYVDPVRFEQIMVNLLNNAAKYTEPGGTITLSAKRDGPDVVVGVSDTGIGIDEKNFKKIFMPFRQIKGSSLSGTGLGIGLSLTRRLVILHGGTISVESPGLNKGSTFICRFPIIDAPAELPFSEKGTRETTMPLFTATPILIVDDNQAAAESLKRLLSFKGYAATSVYSGNEALEAARSKSPGVIFLDIGLPDMTGYEVATKLRNHGFTGKIIALSGYGQEQDKAQAIQAGCNHHLTKPVGLKEIEALL